MPNYDPNPILPDAYSYVAGEAQHCMDVASSMGLSLAQLPREEWEQFGEHLQAAAKHIVNVTGSLAMVSGHMRMVQEAKRNHG